PVSRKVKITQAVGPLVYEIDHQPATAFYQEYLGPLSISGEYPLAVFEPESDRFYLRASNQWDLDRGTVLFMGDVPEQATVQISHATSDNLIHSTHTAIQQAQANYPGHQPSAVLIFSCAARRWTLGSRIQEEYAISQQLLAPPMPLIGFYSYGEISPLSPGGAPRYHQETLVTVLLGME
ncbi:MAG: hypothetical protein HC805_07190, partial [Alkalinema sp. RL_2_19]|nr:hypothetical protein [Alkalinema sp. RL_2_19]